MKITNLILVLILGLVPLTGRAEGNGKSAWLSPLEPEETISAFRKIKMLPSVVIETKKAWTVRVGLLDKEPMKNMIAAMEEVCQQQEPEKLSRIIDRNSFPLVTRLSPSSDFGQEFDLVVVTSQELGLPSERVSPSEPMRKKEIVPDRWEKSVPASGYQLCPAEAAVMLIRQFNQYTDPIYILTEGITGIENPQHLALVLYTDDFGNLGIAVRRVSQSAFAPRVFIVVRPRKT